MRRSSLKRGVKEDVIIITELPKNRAQKWTEF